MLGASWQQARQKESCYLLPEPWLQVGITLYPGAPAPCCHPANSLLKPQSRQQQQLLLTANSSSSSSDCTFPC
jgi:hypothetical protein